MRKTKWGLFVVLCATVLSLLLSGCGGSGGAPTGSAPDTARVEKTVLSAINKAAGKEWTNDESLRGNADVVWNKVDGNGKIRLTDIMYFGTDWIASPLMDYDSFDDNAKFQLIAFTEEELKKYEAPSEELLAALWSELRDQPASKSESVCVAAKNIGGRVYVVYATKKSIS